jgi:hypothetical protein
MKSRFHLFEQSLRRIANRIATFKSEIAEARIHASVPIHPFGSFCCASAKSTLAAANANASIPNRANREGSAKHKFTSLQAGRSLRRKSNAETGNSYSFSEDRQAVVFSCPFPIAPRLAQNPVAVEKLTCEKSAEISSR